MSAIWDPEAVASLDSTSNKVLERLSDPLRIEAYQAKGLVVGYVQSGKTANFSGVIAKAIDAGYRLVIVMTGTVNILREQTQRRIDMELVGSDNILRLVDATDPDVDYQDDPDWQAGRFVSHGFLPSSQGFPDIIRLTTRRFDYRRLQQGITALEFERVDKTKPLHAPENLMPCAARLIVVKKNKTVLEKLVRDLGHIAGRLGEIPALIIDDESDQASVNTSNPKKWQSALRERTAINRLVSQLLTTLPRSQYVGYTATPFANVFIDANDTEDIFPKDFLLGLDRPIGYMGVADFHDLDSGIDTPDMTIENSRQRAHVRDLVQDGPDRELELRGAMDAFVLSGAIKVYREENGLGTGYFNHHTMLVHQSRLKDEHRDTSELLKDLWADAGYASASGMARLRSLFDTDFKPVSNVLCDGDPSMVPGSFDDLKAYVPAAITRMTPNVHHPVIVVNSDTDIDQEPISFEMRPVWRILVGGAKLSRGFTVEGLTISYYRRITNQADTLMQAGRWFGFRNHYRDLVRLYIGRREPGPRGTTTDLYEDFESILRVEEDFRSELRRYAVLVNGLPQITPSQIPPLVSQHVPWLRPTASNKMFNARLVLRRSPGIPVEPNAYPQDQDDIAHNYDCLLPVLKVADKERTLVIPPAGDGSGTGSFQAYLGEIDSKSLINGMSGLRWSAQDYFRADLAFLEELGDEGVDGWVVIVPQLGNKGYQRTLPGVGVRSLSQRKRRRDIRFGAISDPKHRPAAIRIAGGRESYGDPVVEGLHRPRWGAVLIYPTVEETLDPARSDESIDAEKVTVGFVIVAPNDVLSVGSRPLVTFVARNSALPNVPNCQRLRPRSKSIPAGGSSTRASSDRARSPKSTALIGRLV